jgi:hypothetical protein
MKTLKHDTSKWRYYRFRSLEHLLYRALPEHEIVGRKDSYSFAQARSLRPNSRREWFPASCVDFSRAKRLDDTADGMEKIE